MLECFPRSDGHSKSMNKLTLNKGASKCDELCSEIHYNFILSLNLPSDLNENYTTHFYICEKWYHIINDFSLSNEQLTILALFTCKEISSFHEKLEEKCSMQKP